MPSKPKGSLDIHEENEMPKGKNYLLAIAIDEYENVSPLSNCVKDAKDFINILTTKYDFEEKQDGKPLIFTLFNEQATRGNILSKLTNLKKIITPNDNLILYYSGHGEIDTDTGYWIPVDGTVGEDYGFVSTPDITHRLNAIKSFHTFLLVDACFAGSLFLTHKNIKKAHKGRPSRWGLAASHSREVALDGTPGENSPFAGRLLHLLKNNDEDLGIQTLCANLIQEVERVTQNKQTPVFQPLNVKGHELGQFVFRLKKDEEGDWVKAAAMATLAAFEKYLTEYPKGKYARVARERVSEFTLVEDINEDIEEGIVILQKWNYRKARTRFKGILSEVEGIENEKLKNPLLKSINKQLDLCANLPKYRPFIEKIIKKEFEDILAKKEAALAQLTKELKAAAAMDNDKNEQLKAAVASKTKELLSLKAILKTKDDEITTLKKAIKQGETIYQKQQIEIRELQQEVLKFKTPPKPKVVLKKDYIERIDGVDLNMVFVKGGTFMMGSNDGHDDEKPIHEVNLSDYYIGKYPVTQALWKKVMGDNPSDFKGDKLPVENVSWNDVQGFIKQLNKKTNKKYRLLSEAEWEYAARGGNKNKAYKYAGSDNIRNVAWYDENAEDKTHPVGEKDANELGIHDMSGNVWEWCQDEWHDDYNGAPNDGSAWEDKGSNRVIRGGSWYDDARHCRVSNRNYSAPSPRNYFIGFRLAHSSK